MFRRSYISRCVQSILTDGSVAQQFTATKGANTVRIAMIPMLHVASKTFYDSVLDELKTVTETCLQQTPPAHTFVVKEGVAVTTADREQEVDEITNIASNATMAREVERLAKTNTIYNAETLNEICTGYAIPPGSIVPTAENPMPEMVLQDSYFVPLLIANLAPHMVLGDIVLEEQSAGPSSEKLRAELQSGLPLHQLLDKGVIKGIREENCYDTVMRCLDNAGHGSFIYLLWGHHHTNGLRDKLLHSQVQSKDRWVIRPSQENTENKFGGFTPQKRPYGLTDELRRVLASSSGI